MNTTCHFEVDIAEKDIQLFSRLSGDTNPLHMDPAYASTTEFGRPIAHGAYLIGLVSRVLGMYIPGRESLILSMNVRFPKPLYYPAHVRVSGKLRAFSESRNLGTVDVRIEDAAKGWSVVEADVIFSCHQKASVSKSPEHVKSADSNGHSSRGTGQRRLLVTGGTGGIGSYAVAALLQNYAVDCLTRNPVQKEHKDLRYHQVDMEQAHALETFLTQIHPRDYYAILHLSSPPMSRGFASDDIDLVQRHLRQSIEVPLLLTQWARKTDSVVKRIILLGSTAGAKYPKAHAGAYSLGKASMEHLVSLLPIDLAMQKATINVIIPSIVPAGMNEGMPERSRKMLEARMPLGRLLGPSDITHVIEFLLSDGANQVNGSAITVDGGYSEAS